MLNIMHASTMVAASDSVYVSNPDFTGSVFSSAAGVVGTLFTDTSICVVVDGSCFSCGFPILKMMRGAMIAFSAIVSAIKSATDFRIE